MFFFPGFCGTFNIVEKHIYWTCIKNISTSSSKIQSYLHILALAIQQPRAERTCTITSDISIHLEKFVHKTASTRRRLSTTNIIVIFFFNVTIGNSCVTFYAIVLPFFLLIFLFFFINYYTFQSYIFSFDLENTYLLEEDDDEDK